ncbi:MAG: hypothetical protein U0167_08010 [bacterium]
MPKAALLGAAGGRAPAARFLSNGAYRVLVSDAGTGGSWWDRHALTSFSGDAIEDDDGLFVYVRDLATGSFWSAGRRPVPCADEGYEVQWSPGTLQIVRECRGISTRLAICVAPDEPVEIRRITLLNRSARRREIELTTLAEIVLHDPRAHASHPGFSKLFVQTEQVRASRAILARRRPRADGEAHPWMVHALLERDPSFETSRERFLGRGGTKAAPAALTHREPFAGTEGNVLDPVASLRDVVTLGPGETAQATFLLGVAAERRDALGICERFARRGAVDAAFEAAARSERDVCREAGITESEAEYFQSLAAAMLYRHPALRADASTLARAAGSPGDLARFGIPRGAVLAVLHAEGTNGRSVEEEFLRAATYWRMRGLPVQAIVLGHREGGGGVVVGNDSAPARFLARADLSSGRVDLVDAVARLVVTDALQDLSAPASPAPAAGAVCGEVPCAGAAAASAKEGHGPPPADTATQERLGPERAPTATLELFNGFGGFAEDGREYVIPLTCRDGRLLRRPPRPWINVVANEGFGFLVSETGAGNTWSGNSREHRLTPWYNDPLLDPHGEALYVRDDETGAFWSPLPGPAPRDGDYEVRHGLGYTRCRHLGEDLETETTLFVPRHDPVKITTLRVTNRGARPRRLSLFAYSRLVLGVLPEDDAAHVVSEVDTEVDAVPGRLFARNRLADDFAAGVAFAAVATGTVRSVHVTADRATFLGWGGCPSDPAALRSSAPLDGRVGAGLDPCFAQQVVLELATGASAEVTFLLGEGQGDAEARSLIDRYAAPGAAASALADVRQLWSKDFGGLRIETPSRALDVLVNGWLAYQTVSCRLWGRTALYQSGGAFGFRDQLQDAAALVWLSPERTRAQILLHAAHQFVEGDVLHWWHPPAGRGIRTRFADDLLWLPLVTADYVAATGDRGILGERVGFVSAPALRAGEDEIFLLPEAAGERADLYEHCCRALDRSLTSGPHGLPLFGAGDWNDGMNRVGRGGRGESVWMAFFLDVVLGRFLPLCRERADAARVQRYETHRARVREAVEGSAWDGEWYRRGYYDDGTPLGSRESDECQIDALVQAWSVISGVAPPERAVQAMRSVEQHLVADDDGIVRLLTPPFENTPHDPGYIKGYVRGVRENGGQYTHAALWVVAAMAGLRWNDRAAKLLERLSPVAHSRTEDAVRTYQVEPYVVAADIYGEPPHVGRGGWTWYTGSAGWMYRVTVESILGLRLVAGEALAIAPCVPDDWPEFSVTWRRPGEETRYEIRVINNEGHAGRVVTATLDGATARLDHGTALVPLAHDGRTHRVEIVLGPRGRTGGTR